MTFAIGGLDEDDFFDYEPYYTLPSPKFRSPGIKSRKAEPTQKVTTVSDLIKEYRFAMRIGKDNLKFSVKFADTKF